MKIKLDRYIQDFLEEFSLSEREIVIYLTLLKTGPNTIMNLARETAIKRSTTHNNVEELIKKGLVSQTNFGERRMVVAEDPEKLKFLVDQKKWRMKKLEENLPAIIEQINQMVPEARENSVVQVKYFEGEKSVLSSIYEDALNSTDLYSFVNLAEVLKILPDNASLFIEALKKNSKLHLWEIFDRSNVSHEYTPKFSENPRHKIKFTNSTLNLEALDILIYEGKVATVTFKDKVRGFVIYSEEYHNSMKALFQFIWKILE